MDSKREENPFQSPSCYCKRRDGKLFCFHLHPAILLLMDVFFSLEDFFFHSIDLSFVIKMLVAVPKWHELGLIDFLSTSSVFKKKNYVFVILQRQSKTLEWEHKRYKRHSSILCVETCQSLRPNHLNFFVFAIFMTPHFWVQMCCLMHSPIIKRLLFIPSWPYSLLFKDSNEWSS